MTGPLAQAHLQLKVIPPAYFVPVMLLLGLLVEREIIRAFLKVPRPEVQHVIGFAVRPLLLLFALLAGLHAYTLLR